MSNKVFFYQNNPCVIVRDVNDDFAEVQINHRFAESMELSGHCQGCLVGDGDNKLPCTCEDFSWIIEEFQNEDNKIIAMVEKRLLLDSPIEKISIDRLEREIKLKVEELEKIKLLHVEWELSLKSIKSRHESLNSTCKSIECNLSELKIINEDMAKSNCNLESKRQQILIDINDYSILKKNISIKELDELKKAKKKLDALESGGVDNWDWYEESLKNAGLI